MIFPHVHAEDTSVWSARAMRAHLIRSHGRTPPMAWEVGGLHQHHLTLHLAAQTPEEKPMPETHNHGGDIARFHDTISRSTLANHLEHVHGLKRQDIDLRELYSQHASLHPMPKTQDDEAKVENLAQLLYGRDADGPQPDWDDLGQETRDHYRDRARTSLARVRDGRVNRVNQAEPTEGERRILEDRIICAMTGLDFDGDWVKDESLSLRRAMRYTYVATADRLVTWLNHGGALHLPPVASLAEELETERSIRSELEETNADLVTRSQSAQSRWAEANRQLEEVTAERDLLREDKAQLKSELADSEQRRQGLFDGMGELRQQLEQVREKAENRDAVAVELMRVQEQLEHTRKLLKIRTEALATGRLALIALVRDLKQDGWDQSTVFQRLQALVDGQAEVVTCNAPHLGLARTREILAELTSRIDLGHCGLEYRTVDDD